MKALLPVLLLLTCAWHGAGQSVVEPDTLLQITFEHPEDSVMLHFSTGKDTSWVNWDGDGQGTKCGKDTIVPGGWYIEGDLGDFAFPPKNYAYTSCSWLNPGFPNNNWLITPPIFISDPNYTLSWRSLAFQGPQFMDGYQVLVSKSLNLPDTAYFKDTLFTAAQMLGNESIYTLDLHDYQFSKGYIHGDQYQNTDYFYLDLSLGPVGLFHGRLEPHAVSLQAYTGDTIYVAFLHDSQNDYLLQIDDIVVSNTVSSTRPIDALIHFAIQPNPVGDVASISWEFTYPMPDIRLQICNDIGQIISETSCQHTGHANYRVDTSGLQPGIYFCTLLTPMGRSTRRMIKF